MGNFNGYLYEVKYLIDIKLKNFRSAANVGVVQPLTCLLFPYLAYLIAESLGLSGILA